MNRQVVLYIAASLDGFIADADNELDWLLSAPGEGDNGFSEFYQTVDTVLLGRKTYDWIRQHEGGKPYADKECYVFSRFTHDDAGFISLSGEELVRFIGKLKSQKGRDIWLVGGGELIREFLNAGLVDQLRISVAPMILSSGIPLFRNLAAPTELALTGTKQYGQLVELCYNVKKN